MLYYGKNLSEDLIAPDEPQEFKMRDTFNENFFHRSRKVLKLALPAMIAIVITFGYMMVNATYAGKLNDPRALAGISLSNILTNGLWFTTFNGFSGALQTLVSQAASRKEYHQCSNVLRVALSTIVILYIPLGIIMYKIDWIMGESMFNADSGSLNYAIQY